VKPTHRSTAIGKVCRFAFSYDEEYDDDNYDDDEDNDDDNLTQLYFSFSFNR
jgi:hypothetical protein